LSKLPARFREIFLLREMDDLSREEIADRLNLKGNHVGVLLFRARAELQQCLHVNWLKNPKAKTV
jgi:RNA polymerase sigma-70 factor (ECF subfamily)